MIALSNMVNCIGNSGVVQNVSKLTSTIFC